MNFKIGLLSFFFLGTGILSAQNVESKKLEHIISIQANELIRQIINLDADNSVINNPYLINYSLIHNKSKFGIMAGFGYSYGKTVDKETPGNNESRLNEISARLGIARKFILGKKLHLIGGIDFVKQYFENKTVVTTVVEQSNFINSTTNVSYSIDDGYGGGFQVRLGWDITNTISLGTEATLYYMKFSEKDHTLISQSQEFIPDNGNNSYSLSASNSFIEKAEFVITAPVAIFIGIKF